MLPLTPTYPVELRVDYPDRPLRRVSTLLRPVFALPVLVVLAVLGGGQGGGLFLIGLANGLLVLPPLLTIVFRRKYPRWWFDFNLAFLRFDNRVVSYLLLLSDEVPSTDEEQAVHLDMPYPDAGSELNRWLPLVKWLLAVPHYLALVVLDAGVVLAAVAAWVSVVVTGRYPQPLFRYIVGVMRWHNRVVGYAFALVTDQYPPFRLAV